jgi:hypothetical protein
MARSTSSRAYFPAAKLLPALLTAMLSSAPVAMSDPLSISIDIDSLIAQVPPTFAPAFGWEMAVMQDEFLSHLSDPAYIAIASHLAPAIVRVGGITADWAYYVIDSEGHETATKAPQLEGYWPTSEQNFTTAQFTQLLNFFNASGLRLLFDLNELHGRNCQTINPSDNQSDWCVGEWDTTNVRAFLQYIHDNKLVGGNSPLFGFELGNELIGHLPAWNNTQDILLLAEIIKDIWSDVPAADVPPLYAPSTDSCSTNDTYGIMVNVTGVVRGFTYHAYPGGSATAPQPTLQQLLLNSTWLRTQIMQASDSQACIDWWAGYSKNQGMELWVTESSSSWNYQLPAPAQNSFLHGFFTIAELGQYATTGVGLVARWAFSEQSPFGTIVTNASRPGWDVATDYFTLLTYKWTVGGGVLAVSGDESSNALIYSHCSPANNGSITVLAVNPSADTIVLSLNNNASQPIPVVPRLEYVFTAPNGNLSSLTPVLNGNDASPLRIGEDGSLPPMPAAYISDPTSQVTLPPFSQAFFVLLAAGSAACT